MAKAWVQVTPDGRMRTLESVAAVHGVAPVGDRVEADLAVEGLSTVNVTVRP
jgi:hypothetical protein